MSNDSYELIPDSEPPLPEMREALDAMFGMSEHVYDLLVECIPDIEASDYVLGVKFEEALTLSSNRVCEAKEELEPYFALLSLAFASRSFRNTFSPDSFDDQVDQPGVIDDGK